MSVRVALIGAGIMGADHARILAEDIPGAELTVVCDASDARARAVAEACGAADVMTDPVATIERRDVDAILVASTDETHAPLTLAGITAGKPVLCEKPLAPTAAEGITVVEAEIRAGRRLAQIGFMRRFDPAYAEMRRSFREGRIGSALMMHNFHRNVESPGVWFTESMAISGSAPHEFDVARFVLGTDYASISVFQPKRSDANVAPVFAVLRTRDGQLVNIEVNNNAAYGYDVRAELVGEQGSVELMIPAATRLNAGLSLAQGYAPDWRPRFAEAYRLQNKAWIRSIETGVPSEIAANAWDGYQAILVAEAGARALAEGREVEVERPEAPDLYRAGIDATRGEEVIA